MLRTYKEWILNIELAKFVKTFKKGKCHKIDVLTETRHESELKQVEIETWP